MPMTALTALSGHIDGLSQNLLKRDHVERMIDAKSSKEAFSVLVDLEYAKFFDEATTHLQFQQIIDQGIGETVQFLRSSDLGNVLNVLWLRGEISNLKLASKRLYQSELFSAETGEDWSLVGVSSPDQINAFLTDGATLSLPDDFMAGLRMTRDQYLSGDQTDLNSFEIALDHLYLQWLTDNFASTGGFVSEYSQMSVVRFQLQLALRFYCEGIDAEHLEKAWFQGESGLSLEKVKSVSTVADLDQLVQTFYFVGAFDALDESQSKRNLLINGQRQLMVSFFAWLKEQATGEIASWAPVIDYFETRMRNAEIIRYIMLAKEQGLDTDRIRSQVKGLLADYFS